MHATSTVQSQHGLQGQAEIFLLLVTVGTKRPQDIAATTPSPSILTPKTSTTFWLLVTSCAPGKNAFLHLTEKGKFTVRYNSSVWGPQHAAMAGAQSPRAPAGMWLCRATSSRANSTCICWQVTGVSVCFAIPNQDRYVI